MTYSVQSFVGNSGFIKEIKKIILTICSNTSTVLVIGERGTGKSLFAKVVHVEGKKNPIDFLEMNCKMYTKPDCAFIENLNNFIYENQKTESNGKTVYLSNIERLHIDKQQQLVEILKDIRGKQLNVRFIVSSEGDLDEMAERDAFSKDLYFQISTILVNMLPLRQHREDIPEIASFYFKMNNRTTSSEFRGFSETAKKDIINHFWKGNVAELRNAVERGFIVGNPPYIKSTDLALNKSESIENMVVGSLEINPDDKSLKTALDTFKKNYITKILEENNWNQTKTAKILGIQRTYVIRLINELQIQK